MEINKYIEHTNLKSNLIEIDIVNLCEESLKYDFYNVCILPTWIKFVKSYFGATALEICTVVGFPLGNQWTSIKEKETSMALEFGAKEIDVVINVSDVLQGKWQKVRDEIRSLKKIVKLIPAAKLKIIFETCYLKNEDITYLCKLCIEEKVDFVKTSTGFGPEGATLTNVALMYEVCKDNIEIKASGGIKNLSSCLEFIKAGANRIGTSNGVAIINEYQNKIVQL